LSESGSIVLKNEYTQRKASGSIVLKNEYTQRKIAVKGMGRITAKNLRGIYLPVNLKETKTNALDSLKL